MLAAPNTAGAAAAPAPNIPPATEVCKSVCGMLCCTQSHVEAPATEQSRQGLSSGTPALLAWLAPPNPPKPVAVLDCPKAKEGAAEAGAAAEAAAGVEAPKEGKAGAPPKAALAAGVLPKLNPPPALRWLCYTLIN